MPETFEDRMFMASEAVYNSIDRGEVEDVEAAMVEAHLKASEEK